MLKVNQGMLGRCENARFGGIFARQRKELYFVAKQRVEKLLAVVRNEKFKVDSSGHEDESSLVGSMKVRLLFRRRTKCILLDPSKLLFILTIATYNEYGIII